MKELLRFSVYAPVPRQVVIVDYYLTGHLKSLHFKDNANGGFLRASLSDIPFRIDYTPGKPQNEFVAIMKSGCDVKDITNLELSFEKFWNVYGFKRGNIARSRKLWDKTSDADKIIALGFINKLKAVYEKEGKQMPYPETYLSQKRWENEL
jgi:hypothetical protein